MERTEVHGPKKAPVYILVQINTLKKIDLYSDGCD
jgi:hypothetical protein